MADSKISDYVEDTAPAPGDFIETLDVSALDNKKVQIGNLLAGLALDSGVVHRSGAETIAGTKTFTSPIVGSITGNAATATAAAGLSAPIAESQVTGLAADLAARAPTASPTFTGTVTAPVRVATPRADADGATITLDFSASDFHSVTLGGNRTIAFTNATPGQVVRVELVQDATGGRSVTWPTVRWPGGTPPTLTATAGKADLVVVAVRADGTFAGATSIANY